MNTSLEICDCQSLETLDARQCAARIAERGIQGIIWMDNNFTGREPLLEPVRKTGLPVLLPHANVSDAAATGFTGWIDNQKGTRLFSFGSASFRSGPGRKDRWSANRLQKPFAAFHRGNTGENPP